MGFFKEFVLAAGSYFKVFGFVRGWKGFYVAPVVANVLLCFLLFGLLSWGGASLNEYLSTTFSFMEGWGQWIVGFITLVVFLGIVFYGFQFISLILLAPLFAYQAEKVHERLGYSVPEFSWAGLWKGISRGVVTAVRNLFLELLCLLFIYVLCLVVTPLAVLLPVLSFIVAAYFVGYAMVDYRNELNGLSRKESKKYVRAHRGLVLGNGAVFMLSLLVPVLGTFFATSFGVVAAALAQEQIEGGVDAENSLHDGTHKVGEGSVAKV